MYKPLSCFPFSTRRDIISRIDHSPRITPPLDSLGKPARARETEKGRKKFFIISSGLRLSNLWSSRRNTELHEQEQ